MSPRMTWGKRRGRKLHCATLLRDDLRGGCGLGGLRLLDGEDLRGSGVGLGGLRSGCGGADELVDHRGADAGEVEAAEVGVGVELAGADEFDEVGGEVVAELAELAGELVDAGELGLIVFAGEEVETEFAQREGEFVCGERDVFGGLVGVEAGRGVGAGQGDAEDLRGLFVGEVADELGEVGDAVELGEDDVDGDFDAELLGEIAELLAGGSGRGDDGLGGGGAEEALATDADDGGADGRGFAEEGAIGAGAGALMTRLQRRGSSRREAPASTRAHCWEYQRLMTGVGMMS